MKPPKPFLTCGLAIGRTDVRVDKIRKKERLEFHVTTSANKKRRAEINTESSYNVDEAETARQHIGFHPQGDGMRQLL